MKMKAANGVVLDVYDEGDPAITELDLARVIKFRDERTRDERAADLLYLLASHGIALRPRIMTKEILALGYDIAREVADLKPELLARLRAGGRVAPLVMRLLALGWSGERIADLNLGVDEIVINAESDHVTIVGAQNWDNGRIVHRCQT